MASVNQHCTCCSHDLANPSVHQTLEEMEFERGIWSAALDGDLDRVRSFLDKGIDPNIRDQAGYTALHYASRSEASVCVHCCSAGGVHEPSDQRGATPLHRSAYCGHVGVVKLLLDSGADPMLCDDDGTSPLHKAAEQGREEVCEMLVERCPSLRDLKNKRLQTAYELVQQSTPLYELLRPTLDA